MKIAVVGTGSMGSVYAGLLADAGNAVWAIDTWPEHIEAIRSGGLRVEGASGDRRVYLDATSDPSKAGLADLVIIATKALNVETVLRSAKTLIGGHSTVLTIRNGLGSAEKNSHTSWEKTKSFWALPAVSALPSECRDTCTTMVGSLFIWASGMDQPPGASSKFLRLAARLVLTRRSTITWNGWSGKS